MAYLLPVEKPRCFVCAKQATVYVYNRFNARNGAYCKAHGEALVKEMSDCLCLQPYRAHD